MYNALPANDTPSESFLEYNAELLVVREGLVQLLPLGWARYAPGFTAAGLTLRDNMPLAEFKQGVRASVRVGLKRNDRAFAELATKLDTPIEDKRYIRELLEATREGPVATSGQVLCFPGTR
jgi:hypothetical protein